MKRYLIIALIVASVFAYGCDKEQPKIVGGDKDEHGCIGSAGYTWCNSKAKCVRQWEEYCEELKENFRWELINSFEDCEKAGVPIIESNPRRCVTGEGKVFIEDIEEDKEQK